MTPLAANLTFHEDLLYPIVALGVKPGNNEPAASIGS
jgi:hypothetical protein